MIDANHQLNLESGMVFAVPIPSNEAADAKVIQQAIDTAISEARQNNILGKEETPFLLKRIAEITQGESLAASKVSCFIFKFFFFFFFFANSCTNRHCFGKE
jgi:pseudouridine-5'-phosphate glycosidase